MNSFVPCKLSEDKVLVRVSFVLFYEQVVGGSQWVVLIVLDLDDEILDCIQYVELGRRFYLFVNLIENGNFVLSNNDTFQFSLVNLKVPLMHFNFWDFYTLCRFRF